MIKNLPPEFTAIDPGKNYAAWAHWRCNGLLLSVGLERWEKGSKPHFDDIQYSDSDCLVIERMRIYPGARKEDQNDLLDVAFSAGLCAAQFQNVHQVYAQDWKGQVPKGVTVQRVIKILGYDPCAGVKKSEAGHIYDAIGIGLWAQGRYK